MPEIYSTDLPNVMHEMIDDEVVIVNLENGTYYSLTGVGGQIWSLLDGEGHSIDSLVARVKAIYRGDQDHISAEVTKFVMQLRDEEIVNVSFSAETGSIPEDTATPGKPFAVPVLEKYTDMEEMLLVDPIHEVNDAGWPKLK